MSVKLRKWMMVPVIALAMVGAYDTISRATGGIVVPRAYRTASQLGLPVADTIGDSMIEHTDPSTLHIVPPSPEH